MKYYMLSNSVDPPPSYHGSQLVEDENQELTQGLSEKVGLLKTLTIDMGTEVREQNKFIKGMDEDFDKTGGFLQATMGRLQVMLRAGHNKYICYLILFALFVFFVCWIIFKTR